MPLEHPYTYIATIERIVDGDTYDVLVDLGFGQFSKQRLRLLAGDLSGVNCYETDDKDPKKRALGLLGKQRALEMMPIGSKVLITTKMDKVDGFRRYLAAARTETIASVGDEMLSERLAVVWTP